MDATTVTARPSPVRKKRKPTPPEAVRYRNATPRQLKAFQAKVNQTTPERGDDWWKWRVPCPRCKTDVAMVLRRGRFITAPEVKAICNCDHRKHADRPPDVKSGCGFKAIVPMTVPDDA